MVDAPLLKPTETYTAGLAGVRPTSRQDGPNARRHYMARNKRAQQWRLLVGLLLRARDWPTAPPEGRLQVTLRVQQARGPLPDSDNAAGMCKNWRDGIAAHIGCTDGPSGPEWRYEWARGPDRIEMVLDVFREEG